MNSAWVLGGWVSSSKAVPLGPGNWKCQNFRKQHVVLRNNEILLVMYLQKKNTRVKSLTLWDLKLK